MWPHGEDQGHPWTTLRVWVLQGPKDPDVEGAFTWGPKGRLHHHCLLCPWHEKQWHETGVGTLTFRNVESEPREILDLTQGLSAREQQGQGPSPARPWLSPCPSGTQNAPLLL